MGVNLRGHPPAHLQRRSRAGESPLPPSSLRAPIQSGRGNLAAGGVTLSIAEGKGHTRAGGSPLPPNHHTPIRHCERSVAIWRRGGVYPEHRRRVIPAQAGAHSLLTIMPTSVIASAAWQSGGGGEFTLSIVEGSYPRRREPTSLSSLRAQRGNLAVGWEFILSIAEGSYPRRRVSRGGACAPARLPVCPFAPSPPNR